MAANNWLKEIDKGLNKLDTTGRNSLPDFKYHRLVLKRNLVIDGFIIAAEKRAAKKGLTTADIRPYNTTQQWTKAFNSAWNHVSMKMHPRPNPRTLGELKQIGDRKGLFIEKDKPEVKTIISVPRGDVAKGGAGVGRLLDGLDRTFRRKMWEFWSETSGVKQEIGKNASDIGEEVPSAHRDTIGKHVVLEYFEELLQGINQDLEESFFGTFIDSTEFVDIKQKILDAIVIDWEEEDIPDYNSGELRQERIITVDVVEKSLNQSNFDDLQYLKPSIIEAVEDILFSSVAMQNPEFEGSKTYIEKSTDLAVATLIKNTVNSTKKGKSLKSSNVKKPTAPKKIKRGASAKKSKAYKSHVQGGLSINKITVAKVSAKRKRKAVDSVLKVTNQINKRLGAEVRRNMGRPALINQTGDFSNSARLLELHPTTKGLSGSFTYTLTGGGRSKNRKNVYRTFENGIWPSGYNPKPLIAKSIRKLAMIYTDKKITSLRRT